MKTLMESKKQVVLNKYEFEHRLVSSVKAQSGTSAVAKTQLKGTLSKKVEPHGPLNEYNDLLRFWRSIKTVRKEKHQIEKR